MSLKARARDLWVWAKAIPWLGVLNLLVSLVSFPVAVAYWLAPTRQSPGWALAAVIWLLIALTGLVVGCGLLLRAKRQAAVDAHGETAQLAADLRASRQAEETLQDEVDALHQRADLLGEALELYHDAFHELRFASKTLVDCALAGEMPTTLYRQWVAAFQQCLRGLAEFYTRDTGQQCHVVVKQLVPPRGQDPAVPLTQDNAMVLAIARSHPGAPTRAERRIPLGENSDYLDVLQEAETRYFFSNDLDNHPGYRNPTRGNRYNSAIVWPIVGPLPGLDDPDRLEVTSKMAFTLGFLSVDAPRTDAFDDPVHSWLGAALADTLFAVLSARFALMAQLGAERVDN